MSVLNSIILGIIHAFFEFLPVSSFGIMVFLRGAMGMDPMPGLLFEAMVHIGTAVCVVFIFWKDFCRIFVETVGILTDLAGNIHVWLHNRRNQEEDLPYHTLVLGSWRKLTAMIWVCSLPTALIGYTARRLAVKAAASAFLPGAFMLATAIFLLVTDLGQTEAKNGSRETGFDMAMWMGICQGLAVFPGLSRLGLTVCAGLLCGQTRKFALKFSVIMSVPASFGAFFMEAGAFGTPPMNAAVIGSYILAALAAFVSGAFTIRFVLRQSQNIRLRWFALFNLICGASALLNNF